MVIPVPCCQIFGGLLAKQAPSTSIMSANEEVKDLLAQGTESTKRGAYTKFTLAQKAEIGKPAAEHDMAAMVHCAIGMVNGYSYLKKNFPKLCANLICENLSQKFSAVRYVHTSLFQCSSFVQVPD